jgi:hypothetical protein
MILLRYARLPTPTSTAAPPIRNRGASWNPAVPPPPVAGAAAGNGLGEGLGEGLGVTDGAAGVLAEGLALSLAEGLAVPLGVGERVPPGENEVSPAEGGGVDPEEQAETAAEASMAMVPRRMMVNLARCPAPAMVVRPFMEPPHAPRQAAAAFPGRGARNRHRNGIRAATRSPPAPGKALPKSAGARTGKALRRHRRALI